VGPSIFARGFASHDDEVGADLEGEAGDHLPWLLGVGHRLHLGYGDPVAGASGKGRRASAWAVDVGLAVALGAAVSVRILLAREPQSAAKDPFAYALGLSIAALALFRRRSPLAVLIGSTVLLQTYYVLNYPGISPALPLSIALATAMAAGHLRWSLSIAGWFVLAPLLFRTLVDPEPVLPVLGDAVTDAALLGAVLLLGEAVRSRRALDREHRLLLAEEERSEQLLLNILPESIASRLKRARQPIADAFPEATVLFADIVGFTGLSSRMAPDRVVGTLSDLFSAFDRLARERGLEKIKTIGDAYMVAAGLPDPRPDHAEAAADMALAMEDEASKHPGPDGRPFSLRIGIDTGPVVAGVIGEDKFAYDLWGDTVNTASRMESTGVPGHIQVTARAYERLRHRYHLEERGSVRIKGKGEMTTYFLLGPRGRARTAEPPARLPRARPRLSPAGRFPDLPQRDRDVEGGRP
jgi:class 3 adenylate cyclase